MPSTIQPVIRSIQEVMETKGMHQTRDTVGVTQIKAQEAAGRVKQVPKTKIAYLGTTTIPS